MATKRCSRCKQEKPVTEFGKDQSRKDGLQGYCRECQQAYNREYRKKNAARNPDEIPIPSETRCPKCGVTRPSSERTGNRVSPDGLEFQCKPCMRAKSAKYYAENGEKHRESVCRWQKTNREKYRENARRWRKANPGKVRAIQHRRRARKAGAFTEPHTPEDLLAFWRFLGIDPERCWYWALDGRDAPMEHVDHVIPLSRGGSETVWNKRPACSKCNTSKNARVFPAGGGDEEARRIAREQANLTRLWMAAHNLID